VPNAVNQSDKLVELESTPEEPIPAGKRAYRVFGSRFELPAHFEAKEPVGSGAYGVVLAVKDTLAEEGNNIFAIKKVEKAFEHKVFALRTLRELKIMRLLDHDNILSIQSILMPDSMETFD
jgi:serine/threonine protein kinase